MTKDITNLSERIEELYSSKKISGMKSAEKTFNQFLSLLDTGTIRAAENIDGVWHVHEWVKKGILLGFRLGKLSRHRGSGATPFFDKHTFPSKTFSLKDSVRIVPGGTAVRKGAYVSPSVIIMPPAYVNVGAYVGRGTMIDSHALVGSCAQVGERVHVSAAAQIGGVLEPVGALPVIIEDDVLLGGNTGVYEGTLVRRGAVIAAGVVLTGSTPVYDCVQKKILRKEAGQPLVIPENAVVVNGSRAIKNEFAQEHHLSISTPLIIKYRDNSTDARTALEQSLR